ncbi:hypothetical protein ACFQY9_19715 [Microvirga aerilata]|uniref:hypothetical protein n=1 Tax=Microvirga aerilata TaxID=670292 RepID=UPI00362B001F
METVRDLPHENVAIDHFSKDFINRHMTSLSGLSDKEAEAVMAVANGRRPLRLDQKVAVSIKHQALGKLAGKVLAQNGVQFNLPGLVPHRPRNLPSSEQRQKRRERRYGLAHGKRGVLVPPTFSAALTPGETAVLTTVGVEINDHGYCDLYVAKIGDLAGCGVKVVRSALKKGKELGLLGVLYRREGRLNKTNLITATPKWSQWLERRKEWKNTRHFSSAHLQSNEKKKRRKRKRKKKRALRGRKRQVPRQFLNPSRLMSSLRL